MPGRWAPAQPGCSGLKACGGRCAGPAGLLLERRSRPTPGKEAGRDAGARPSRGKELLAHAGLCLYSGQGLYIPAHLPYMPDWA
jgi:hypothetical protein